MATDAEKSARLIAFPFANLRNSAYIFTLNIDVTKENTP